eukprot:XP_001706165.1 Hypothetical protein GL50803_99660 [Giardia lamblia ATCC 50803]
MRGRPGVRDVRPNNWRYQVLLEVQGEQRAAQWRLHEQCGQDSVLHHCR